MVVDVGKVVEDHPRAKGRVPCVVAERWNWRLLLARTLSLLESGIFLPLIASYLARVEWSWQELVR